MSTYKIMNNSTVIGTLETCADGLYTIFTARCEPVLPRLRLHVFGEVTHAYLGLMLPENGALYLRRRLSRIECAKLPAPILYAAGRILPRRSPRRGGPRRMGRSGARRAACFSSPCRASASAFPVCRGISCA